jgi:long-chain fatty acid transport protein
MTVLEEKKQPIPTSSAMRFSMNRVRLFIIAFGYVLFGAGSVLATGYGYDTGVKARALGGAFRAVADDWSAAAYNPAGLATLKDNEFGFANSFLHNRYTYNVNYQFGSRFETGFVNGQDIPNRQDINSTPEGGVAVRTPFWGETVVGFSIFETGDQNLSWTLFEGIQGYSSVRFPVDQKQFSINMDIVNFQASFAREFIEDKLSIGLGIALVRGDLNYNNLVLRDNPLDPALVDRPYEKIPELTSSDGNGWSIGGQLGLLWQASKSIRVGATFSPKTTITVDGRTAFEIFLPADSQLQRSEGFLQGTDEFFLTTGFTLESGSNFTAEIVSPTKFGAGVAIDLSEKLTVSIDGEYTLWSQFEGINMTFDSFDSLNITIPQGVADPFPLLNGLIKTDLSSPAVWDDAGSGMIGLMYKPVTTATFMGGFRVDQSITSDSRTTSPQFLTSGTIYTGSLGLSIDVDRWTIQGVASFTHQQDLTFTAPADVNGDGINDNLPATISGDKYQSVFGVIYRF